MSLQESCYLSLEVYFHQNYSLCFEDPLQGNTFELNLIHTFRANQMDMLRSQETLTSSDCLLTNDHERALAQEVDIQQKVETLGSKSSEILQCLYQLCVLCYLYYALVDSP